MAHQLGALVTLPEAWGLISRTHLMVHSLFTPVPEDLMHSSDLCGLQAHTWCTHIHAGQTQRNKMNKSNKNLRISLVNNEMAYFSY